MLFRWRINRNVLDSSFLGKQLQEKKSWDFYQSGNRSSFWVSIWMSLCVEMSVFGTLLLQLFNCRAIHVKWQNTARFRSRTWRSPAWITFFPWKSDIHLKESDSRRKDSQKKRSWDGSFLHQWILSQNICTSFESRYNTKSKKRDMNTISRKRRWPEE
jgi:heme/copper-type cytochrome/quinol oxidase subunit 3